MKRNPLFLHEIEWNNNGFLFTLLFNVKCITVKNLFDNQLDIINMDRNNKNGCLKIKTIAIVT